MCATHLLHNINKHEQLGIQIHAISMDHGLRDESPKELCFIKDEMMKLGIQKTFHDVKLDLSELQPDQPFEELARIKRYDKLHEICQHQEINHLLTGHHFDDDLETFTLRLLDNSGVFGLRGINKISTAPFLSPPYQTMNKVSLIRPLLDFTKDELYQYAKENDIKWVEDHTNKLEITKRNVVRSYIRRNPHRKIELIRCHNQVKNFVDEVENKVNALYHKMKKDGRFSKPTNGFKIKFDKDTIKESSDLVISRFLFKLLYPYSPSLKYHYHFHNLLRKVPLIRDLKPFTLLQLQWTFEDDGNFINIIVKRQTMIGIRQKGSTAIEINLPPAGKTDWFLYDNIYWLKLFNKSSCPKTYILSNLYLKGKLERGIIKDKQILKNHEGLPFIYNKNDPEVEWFFPTDGKENTVCSWMLKHNIYSFD